MINIKKELTTVSPSGIMQLNDLDVEPEAIRAIMINEIVPADPKQDFYGSPNAEYLSTTLPLFQRAGMPAESIGELLHRGIYITNAVKVPKTEYTVDKKKLEASLPYLEKELALFPNVKVILLMGDVAKKAFNRLAKKKTGKNILPAVSTYKLRKSVIEMDGVRVMPSYIMTGGNILIEKSKFEMAAEDIREMLRILDQCADDSQ